MAHILLPMRLRLYHHSDGARVAYRESGTGPALILLHSLGLSHREFEPIVDALSNRFRVVVPDLPLHGDSEDRPGHPYTAEWLTEVLAGFCLEAGGSRASVVGHDVGAELALAMVATGAYKPAHLVLMSNRLHRQICYPSGWAAWSALVGLGAVPGIDYLLSHAAAAFVRPRLGERLTVQRNRGARDLIRHAFSDVGGNSSRARAWAKFVRRWPRQAQLRLLDQYMSINVPVLLLWALEDRAAPIASAQEALDLLPNAQLRTLPDAGFLAAYDDPVAVARELIAFCG